MPAAPKSNLRSKVIPNLIQGVSQQDPAQRRDAQCEYQLNCVNSPRLGVVARHGAEFFKAYNGSNFTGAFCEDLTRDDERYLMTISHTTGVRIFNIRTGIEATLTDLTAGDNYFTATGALDPDVAYDAQQVEDTTFVANRSVLPAMAATLSSAPKPSAMVFVKAGAYSTKYIVGIRFAGDFYRYTFETPDNSNAASGIFVPSNAIANILYQLFTNDTGDVDNGYGVGSKYVNSLINKTVEVNNVATANPGTGSTGALTNHGFTVEINGSLIFITRADGADFTVDSTDGGADAFIQCFKDTVPSYTQLPRGGFLNFTLKVTGASSAQAATNSGASSFWVNFTAAFAAAGDWRERVAPGVKTSLDANTMPHGIINTGLNAFTLKPLLWSDRIAGDGVLSAKDPGFIGKPINTILYEDQRLAIMTDSTLDFSKARNSFTYFPDTLQTVLDDAPIAIEIVSTSKAVSSKRFSQVNGGLTVWGQKQQWRVAATTNLLFTQASVSAKPSTAYEFAERAGFAVVGNQLHFASEPDDYAVIRAVSFSEDGRSQGDVDITAHVPSYIPAGVRLMVPTDTLRMIFVRTAGDPNALYAYNYLIQGADIVQSAWNRWELPEDFEVLWHGIIDNVLHLFGNHGSQAMFLRIPLNAELKDPGGQYRTRYDLRADESQVSMVFATGHTTITLPYNISDDEALKMELSIRTSSANWIRGTRFLGPEKTAANAIRFPGDLTAEHFYVGIVPSAIRDESTFYLRTAEGELAVDTLTIADYELRMSKTGYTRIEIDQGQGRDPKSADVGYGLSITADGPPKLQSRKLKIACDQDNDKLSIRLINDTPLPSRWVRSIYFYTSSSRASQPASNRA